MRWFTQWKDEENGKNIIASHASKWGNNTHFLIIIEGEKKRVKHLITF